MRRRITDAWSRLGSLTPAAGWGPMRRPGSADPTASGNAEPSARPSSNKNKALVAGAGVLAAVAIGGVIVAPKLISGGSSDPGCKTYSATALTAYNKTINDLNAQASQSVLAGDMSATITDLNTAISQAQGASVKSALNGLLTELKSVKTDVQSGSVPTTTVTALNAASTTADGAC
ncbi:MAG: hypothetical protein JWO75_6576 [Actinomycetia bacterium]|nr:hypothetical protein [Actinomycetes bacterium]